MSEPIKKRKAEDQLSPYSQDIIEIPEEKVYDAEKTSKPLRKAQVKRSTTQEKQSLMGIFGDVSLLESDSESKKTDKNSMVAGLNNSFLKAVRLILEKQKNKDLRYLFEQYDKFMKDIEENNK